MSQIEIKLFDKDYKVDLNVGYSKYNIEIDSFEDAFNRATQSLNKEKKKEKIFLDACTITAQI